MSNLPVISSEELLEYHYETPVYPKWYMWNLYYMEVERQLEYMKGLGLTELLPWQLKEIERAHPRNKSQE